MKAGEGRSAIVNVRDLIRSILPHELALQICNVYRRLYLFYAALDLVQCHLPDSTNFCHICQVWTLHKYFIIKSVNLSQAGASAKLPAMIDGRGRASHAISGQARACSGVRADTGRTR